MDPCPEPQRPGFTISLPRDIYYEAVRTLRGILAPISDTQEDLDCRNRNALAQVACLLPDNVDEAHVAALSIAAGAQAMECLRLARQYQRDPHFILKCTAWAASMMRQARATRSQLQRMQAERQKRVADSAEPAITPLPESQAATPMRATTKPTA